MNRETKDAILNHIEDGVRSYVNILNLNVADVQSAKMGAAPGSFEVTLTDGTTAMFSVDVRQARR